MEPDNQKAEPKDRAMWYKGGPLPPVETRMGVKGWLRTHLRWQNNLYGLVTTPAHEDSKVHAEQIICSETQTSWLTYHLGRLG